jgi:hypothetical protein
MRLLFNVVVAMLGALVPGQTAAAVSPCWKLNGHDIGRAPVHCPHESARSSRTTGGGIPSGAATSAGRGHGALAGLVGTTDVVIFRLSGECIATRGVEAAGPRLLSAIPARVTNAANHVFGPNSLAKHKLEGVLGAFKGDATAAFYSLENAAQALANQGAIKGIFQTTVQVAGSNVTVRGAVIDGVARVSTAFIP